ncbi:MAG: acetyl-CoA carboxylase biotin carboxyl carrier protein [Actinomycetes bacterium]|jgi:acetyl-CoA carboxylase biotin carboxyl carrier protein
MSQGMGHGGMSPDGLHGGAPGTGARPEELLAWIAGYAAELASGPGPLRRIAITSGGTSVEVEWAVPERPAPAADARPEAAPAWQAPHPNGAAHGASGGPPPAARQASPNGDAPAEPADPAGGGEAVVISAPMVGTFYRAPEPGAPPYVEVGDLVEAGQQIGIIEAMKLMNPIVAEQSGRVGEILVGDGTPVEYGQPLIVLRRGDTQ